METNQPRRPFSLATRLTFFISLATIAAFFVFASVMIESVKTHFAERDIIDLKQLSAALDNVLKNTDEPESSRLDTIKKIMAGYDNVFIYLEDGEHKEVFHTPGGPDLSHILATAPDADAMRKGGVMVWKDPAPQKIMHHNVEVSSNSWRVIMLPVGKAADGGPAYCLLMALSIDFHLHYLNDLKKNLLLTASAISIIIILIVLLAVFQGHKPIRSVSRRIQNITFKNLDVRLNPHDVPIELERLVMSFNQMISRMEDVFTRQSNFSSDIAHEIRTPITNLVTQTEIALSAPRSQKELEDVLYSNLEEFSRLSKMVSDMLFLAQADNNLLVPEKRELNLNEEVRKVFDYFEAWAEENEVALHLEGRECYVNGDAGMLRRAVSNLVSNAIRYTPRGQTVCVYVKEVGTQVKIVVENPGTPIAKEHLPRLFDRFYRVDPSRQRKSEGSGIGLAIVKSIMTAHHGSVNVASDSLSTRFTLALPGRGE
jgi:two-component system heavy metal sensor histidine kinase CusS